MTAITVRLEDDDLHKKLRLYRAFTGRAANDLINELVREFFESRGDAEIEDAMTRRAKRQHGPALNELEDR